MAQAGTSKASLSFLTEGASYGVPNTSSAYDELRYSTEDVQMRQSTADSDEITSNRRPQAPYRNSLNVTGPIVTPFIYGVHDKLWEWAMLGDWGNLHTLDTFTGTVTFASSDNSLSATGIATGLDIGAWVRVKNALTAGNNGLFRVVTKPTADKITVQGGSLTNETSTAGVEVEQGQGLGIDVANSSDASFTLVRKHSDITQYLTSEGCLIDSLGFEAAADGACRLTWNVRGQTQTIGTSHPSSGGVTAAATTRAFNAVDHMDKVLIGGTVRDCSRYSFNLDNRNFQTDAMGTLGPVSVGPGTAVVTGTQVLYFENGQEHAAFFNGSERASHIAWTDAAGNGYVFSFPATIYTAVGAPVAGRDQAVTQTCSWSAYVSATEVGQGSYGAVAMRVQRWDV